MSQASSVFTRTLDNGLRIVAESRGLGPVVFAGVVYRVGSRDERPGLTGISHLLEHMMFKGTERYGKGDIARIVERNGGDLNAFTSEDVTMYYEVFARDRWTLALDIEAERMANLRIDAAELESEREVVLEERVMYLDIPAVELSEELTAAAFRESPYRWPIIGWEHDIRAASRDDLLAHYRRWYAPDNAALVVVGDVDPDEVFAQAEARFGRIAASGAGAEARRIPPEPEPRGVTRVELERPVGLPHVQVMVRAPGIRTRESEALLLLAHVLSGTRTSRLDVALLETRRAGDVHVQYHPKADPSGFTVMVEGQPEVSLDELEDTVWAELTRLGEELVEPAELDRALTQIEAHRLFGSQSPSSRGFVLGWHEAHGDVAYADGIVERLRAIGADELRETAARVFRRSAGAVARLRPTAVRGGNGTTAGSTVAALHGVFCPRRARRTGLATGDGVRTLGLANGMTAILQPDRTDAGAAVSLLFHAGSALDPPGKEGLASLVADTLERGPASMGFLEFSRRFEDLGTNLSLSAGAELVHGSASFLARHLDSGLNLLADLLEDPGWRAEDLETVRALALNDLQARADDLDDVAEDLFFAAVAGDHPYGRLPHGTEAGVRAVVRGDLAAFHAEAFRPDSAHLAIVGDFDDDAIERLLRARFGALPGPVTPRPSAPPVPAARRELVRVETRRDKGQAKILFGGPGWSATDPDRLAGIAMNHVLGGSSIRSRLGDEIRDRQGLAYSVHSRNHERSGGGFFSVAMGTRPANVRRAVESIRAELARMAEGPTDEELRDAQEYLTGSFPLRFTTYGRLARFRARASFFGWPDDYLATYVDRVRALTAADLARAGARVAGLAGVLAVAGPVDATLEPVPAAGADPGDSGPGD